MAGIPPKPQNNKPGQPNKPGMQRQNSVPGQPKVGQNFGADFGGVRVNQGQKPNAMGARAFTQGNAPAFNRQPSKPVLGHESAHVMQQRGNAPKPKH